MNGRRLTYAAAGRANWPRPTCVICYAPCAYDREFRGRRMCQRCYTDEPLIIQKGIMLCQQKLPS